MTNTSKSRSPKNTADSTPQPASMDDAASVHSTTSSQNDVFAIDESFVPSQNHKSAATTQVSFDDRISPPLLLHEDLQEGCGGQLWPAGMVLSKYMISYHKADLAGKMIIELGAGGGLVGLAVARGCSSITYPILITDQLPMLSLMQRNIQLNSLESQVLAQIYDWGSPVPEKIIEHFPPSPSSPQKNNNHHQDRFPDIILAADCVYFEPAFPLLLQTLTDLMGSETVCYFCFKKRRKADWRFIKEMQKKFETTLVVYDEREVDQREGIHMYEICRKAKATTSTRE